MNNKFEEFKEKFKIRELEIIKTDYWTWSVRPVHCTIGAGVLSLNRYEEKLSNITKEESCDLINIIKIIEDTVKKAFNYDIMNYLMLMMVDPHVHYHVVPRYSEQITFSDLTWIDKGWPKLPVLTAEQYEDNILLKVKEELKKNI